MAGFALRCVGRPRAALRWMADHATREGVEPWMLTTVALSLRSLRREPEARRIELEAAEAGGDEPHPWHAAWLAFDAAIGGDAEAADHWIAAAGTGGLDSLHGYVLDLATVVRDLDRTESSNRQALALAAARRIIEAGRRHSVPQVDRPLALRAWRRAVRRVIAPVAAWRRPLARIWMELSPPIYRPGG
jgi:hypothetical protein